MKRKRLSLLVLVAMCVFTAGTFMTSAPQSGAAVGLAAKGDATPEPYPDAHKVVPDEPVVLPVPGKAPNALTHPCGNFNPAPPIEGVSPLSFTVAGTPPECTNSPYGDIAVWQHNGNSYVGSARFGGSSAFHIWNVNDAYNPVHLVTVPIPGGTNTITLFAFKQGTERYLSMSTRGSGCGFVVYNVTNPSAPTFVTRKTGSDWCIVHEHFVSTDANGDADFAWLAMSGESGSGWKVVVLSLANLTNPVETNRYQRPDAGSSIFIHDVTVVGNRVYLGHWSGGVVIFDKTTLATVANPTPLNPIDSIRPSGFRVHQAWPTTDGNYVFIEDEFLNTSNAEKVKMYDITDINNPQYVLGIVGGGIAATQQAHNLKIINIAPGIDQLLVAWYRAGSRGFLVNTTIPGSPTVTENLRHEYRQSLGTGFGGAWGMDFLPCTLRGQPHTCVYTADYQAHGIIIDALGDHPELDPYRPDIIVTSGNTFNECRVTLTGTASDYYSGLSSVQVSINNGPWMSAKGTTAWTFNWRQAHPNGQYDVRVRASDRAVPPNVRELAPFTITVGGCAR